MDTALNPNNYPTYQIGDRVTIRQWDDMAAEFGLNRFGSITVPESFTEEMKRYCGKTFTIARIEEGEYGFPVYFFSGNGYAARIGRDCLGSHPIGGHGLHSGLGR